MFFTELYYLGGLSRFITLLVENWPKEDNLIFICNENIPGLSEIKAKFKDICEVVTHEKGVRAEDQKSAILGMLPKKIRTGLAVLGQYVTLGGKAIFFWRLIRRYCPDRIMIINGGYPGGFTCRAVALGGLLRTGANKPIMNYHNLPLKSHWLISIPEYLIDFMVGKGVSCFVTVSEICKQQLINRPGLFRVKKKKVILNGTAISPVGGSSDIRSELRIPKENPIILMLATYEERKGHIFLIKAFEKVKRVISNAHLVIAGDGSAKEIEKVKNVVNYYSFSKEVHFLGFRNDTVDLLRQSEVVVVPSQHSESFGLTIVESMAQRVPVVATAVGGIPEVLENGKGGYVVPLDPNLFAEKIIFLLKDPLLRKSVGEIGYEVVQQRFTIKRMVEDYYHLTRHPA